MIVPGVRIGKWTLQMTLDDLLREIGPSIPQLYTDISNRRDFWVYIWNSFAVYTSDKKKIEVLVAGRGMVSPVPVYRTDKGITLSRSTRSDIVKAYGETTVVLKTGNGQSIVVYDGIGLGFRLLDEDAIRLILVFQSGSAKSIWKF